MPYVSIILPTYNRVHCIANAIDSVVQQWYEDWELMVVDDGSIDGTEGVVRSFQDERVTYIKKENGGPASARNVGLDRALGEIITYLDSDDVYFSEAVGTVVDAFAENPNGVFGIGNQLRKTQLVGEGKQILAERNPWVAHMHPVTLQDVYHWNIKFCGSSIFHTKAVVDAGFRWDEEIPFFEDWDLLLRMGNRFPEGFVHVPELMCEYRLQYGSDSINSKSDYRVLGEAFANIYERHKDDPLMEGQQWHPDRFDRYSKWQDEVDAGTRPSATYKYFGDWLANHKS